jgi:hypothetical protein
MWPKLPKMGPPLCGKHALASGALSRTNLMRIPHSETEAFGVVKGDELEARRDAAILAALGALGMR